MALRLATFVALVLTTTAVFPASHGTLGAGIVVLAASHAAPTGSSPTSRCAPSVHCPSLTVHFK
jgi:hypothetical protein